MNTDEVQPSPGDEAGKRHHPPRRSVREVLRGIEFLIIGGLAFVVDAGVYNALVFLGPVSRGILFEQPIIAKVIAIILASVASYYGNRVLTYRDRDARLTLGRGVSFVVINVIAALLQIACLGVSRYVLGYDSIIADNISGTIVGQIIATAFRYVTYPIWVYPKHSP